MGPRLVGINVDASNPGFQNIILKPNFIKAMDFAKASYNSIYGEIKAEWTSLGNDTYKYKVEVPTNCEAKVVLRDKTTIVKSGTHSFTVKK